LEIETQYVPDQSKSQATLKSPDYSLIREEEKIKRYLE